MTLSTRARLTTLMVVMLAAFVSALVGVQRFQEVQLDALFRDRARQESAVLERVLRLDARGYAAHVRDYSSWDEFVTWMRTRDRTWADVNLLQAVHTFNLDYAWVLDTTGATAYATHAEDHAAHAALPADRERLHARLARTPFVHAFARTPVGALEYWTAPIQPTADTARVSPAAGYYVVARLWDDGTLQELSRLTGGRASLIRAGAAPGVRGRLDQGRILVDRMLGDLTGAPVAVLRCETVSPVFLETRRNARGALALLVVISLAALAAAYAAIDVWVARPLQRVHRALLAEDPAPLGGLVRRWDEFGRMAAVIAEFFRQRDALVGEVRERRRAEAEAALQKDYVHQVLDTDPNPVYVVDAANRFVLANDVAHRAFGAAPGGLPGRDVDEVLAPLGAAAAFHRMRERALESGEPQQVEELVTLADGRIARWQTVRCPLRREVGEGQVLTISVDVTERVRQQLELQQAKEAAEAAGLAKSTFLANISHELRTPMHGILSYARFGIREAPSAEREELLDFFQNIHDSGQSLLALLNDLLDLAKLDSGRMRFELDTLHPSEVIDAALVEFEPLAHERGLQLVAGTALEVPEVRADRAKLLQVMRNLLSNAAKFTPAGRRIMVETAWDERRVRVLVRDEGPGIPEGELESIFDRFVQSSATRPASGGTGLGLAICREIVQAHGGRIWAENAPAGGACFHVERPRAAAAAPGGDAAAVDDRAA